MGVTYWECRRVTSPATLRGTPGEVGKLKDGMLVFR